MPRTICIRTDSAQKIYDGKALSCDTYTITGGSLAAGEQISISCTSITEVGYSDNYVLSMEASLTEPGWVENSLTDCRIWRGTSDVTQCYEIEYVLGRLEVTDLESVKP